MDASIDNNEVVEDLVKQAHEEARKKLMSDVQREMASMSSAMMPSLQQMMAGPMGGMMREMAQRMGKKQ